MIQPNFKMMKFERKKCGWFQRGKYFALGIGLDIWYLFEIKTRQTYEMRKFLHKVYIKICFQIFICWKNSENRLRLEIYIINWQNLTIKNGEQMMKERVLELFFSHIKVRFIFNPMNNLMVSLFFHFVDENCPLNSVMNNSGFFLILFLMIWY